MEKSSEEILNKFSNWLAWEKYFLSTKISCRRISKKFYSTPYGKFLKSIYRVWVRKERKTLTNFKISVLIKLVENRSKKLPLFQIYFPKEGKDFKNQILEEIVFRMKAYEKSLKIKVEESKNNPSLSTETGEYVLLQYETF